MNKRLYCVECGAEGRDVEATETVDDDPVCPMHGRVLAALSAGCAVRQIVSEDDPRRGVTSAVKPGEPCRRGCGRPMHRGLCKGQSHRGRPARAASVEVAAPRKPVAPVPGMDAFRRANPGFTALVDGVDVEIVTANGGGMDVLVCKEIPVGEVPSGRDRNLGRLGALWARLMATPFGMALEVECRDKDHAGHTARHMTLKARRAGVAIVSRKVGKTYYCHRVKEAEAAR